MSWQSISLDKFGWIKDLEALTLRKDIVARVIRWQLAKRRAGTHSVKEEGEISGSGRKIYRQKGTGNARQGSRRTPHFKGGAVVFGPHPRDHSFHLPKKIRLLGIRHAVASLVKEDRFRVFDDLSLESYKTRDLKKVLNNKAPLGFKKILCVDHDNDNLLLSSRNIVNMNVLPVCGLNVYDLLKHDIVFVSEKVINDVAVRLKYA